jgi:hypothetical protein
LVLRGLDADFDGLLVDFGFRAESVTVMIFTEDDLGDLSDLRLLPRSRSVTGEAALAGAATSLPPYRSVVGLEVHPSLVPNSAVFVEVAPLVEAAPDEWAVDGASKIPSNAGSISDPYG